jgi:hypothetical protein
VYATVVESLIAAALREADVRDPEIDDQHLSPERALRELGRIRAVTLDAAGKTLRVVTRRNALQSRALAALGVRTGDWDRAHIR